ncbi:MARVEL domain-containing protein [Caenorhabditis elegans]|uniref:MARVEL domain-containing protein n=3 Tax=Caenorhabditis elegans TaxID=6239 RepID=P83386_CAEEL|nr:MARVEL domain-containing protein [Caenorhabditis elegans]CCD70213.1 MARVEL domain-containing protein [Caenorhabditis elegans]|eukprot:NP_001021426.1 Uncharacterized protein CELE_F28H1.4 [Caenorhabditis elegans]
MTNGDNVSIVTLDPVSDGISTNHRVILHPEALEQEEPPIEAPSPPPLPPPIQKSAIVALDPTHILQNEESKSKKEQKKEKMYDSPRYQTTTTVVETTEYIGNDGPAVRIEFPRLDCEYIRTLGGIMKIVCIVLCLLTFIFVMMGPAYYTGVGWATFVSSVGIFVTTSLLTLYLFRVVDTLPSINWIVCEMVYCFAWTVFFFIAACVLAVASSQFRGTFAWAIAAFFAFGAMCAYGFDCYLKFLSWKNNERATGGSNPVVIQQQQRRNNFV